MEINQNMRKMMLTPEEEGILNGEQGPVMQKVMASVALYGEVFEAQRLVPIIGSPHHALSFGPAFLKTYFGILQELIDAGISTKVAYTTNPRPVDYDLDLSLPERLITRLIYRTQPAYERQLLELGLDESSYTCTCYLPEVGNTPKRGDVLAWAESSAVVFANSVLGARTNRNTVGIELMCSILGKAPLFGFLTDQGRKASWLINCTCSSLPNPQLLGSAIGLRVLEDVPYVTGLDRLLGKLSDTEVRDYLKEMGAACASNGAVGLFHIENITPEARESGRSLLSQGCQTYEINDRELGAIMDNYPVLWKNKDARPRLCLIGCPHLSYEQLRWWCESIQSALQENDRDKIAVTTYLCAAPSILKKIKAERSLYEELSGRGVRFSAVCPAVYMNNPLTAKKSVITNSNKLRTYSTARFYDDREILRMITE